MKNSTKAPLIDVVTQNPHLMVNGRRLEFAWHGPGPEQAPTLVFLHEGLGCVAMWRDFPAKLAAMTGCGAFVYSRFGYGQSESCALPRPLTFMHEEGLRVLPEVLATAGIRQCVLIGHSDGGSIAIIYAGGTLAAPLRGLILEAPHLFCESLTRQSIERVTAQYHQGELQQRLEKYHGANTACAFEGWSGAWLHPDFVSWNIEHYVAKINVPILLIQGEQDEYGTTAQVEAIARQARAGVDVLLLPDCGHAPHRDQEAATLQAMSAFVSRIIG